MVAERATVDFWMSLIFAELEPKFRLQCSKFRIQQVCPSGFNDWLSRKETVIRVPHHASETTENRIDVHS